LKNQESFKNALYISKGAGRSGLLVTSFIFGFFAILVIVIMNAEKWRIAKIETIVCSVILVLCIIIFVIAMIRNITIFARVSFAVFNAYILVYTKDNTNSFYYAKICYEEIREYHFEPDITYDSDDTAHLFPHIQNYGDLSLNSKHEKFKVQIKDISTARKWMGKFVDDVKNL
jgi:hypothetical protein